MSTRLALGSAIGVSAVIAVMIGLRWHSASAVPTMVVKKETFLRKVTAEGNLVAVKATPISVPMAVEMPLKIAWLAPDGSRVKSGDVLVRFDPTDMERDLHAGETDRETAESKIEGTKAQADGVLHNLQLDAGLAENELDFTCRFQHTDQNLFSRNQIVESQLDERLAAKRQQTADAVRQIQGDLSAAEMRLLGIEKHVAELRIDRARGGLQSLQVAAPHDGVFVLKRDWRGDVSKVGDVVWPAEAIAEIPAAEEVQAEVYVLEADAGGLIPGRPATVSVEAHPEQPVDATTDRVDSLAKPRLRGVPVQFFSVTLKLKRCDPEIMKPGQRVVAILVIDERHDVIAIPRSAVGEKDGATVVWKLQRGGLDPAPVRLGPAALGRVIVEQGLAEGDTIALRDPAQPAGEPPPVARAASANGRSANIAGDTGP